jgi:hypothetical protein
LAKLPMLAGSIGWISPSSAASPVKELLISTTS